MVLGSVRQQHHALRIERLGSARIVRHQHYRAQIAAQRVEHLLARCRVEIVGGLIQQQHVRGGGHQSGQGQAGLLTAGQRSGGLFQLRSGEHERAEQTAQILLAGVGSGVTDVLPHRGVVVEGVVFLGEVADLHPVAGFDGAGIGFLDSGEHPQQGGLARTVEAQHDHPGAPVDGQINTGEHFQRAVGLGQTPGHHRGLAARRGVREPDLGDLVGHPLGVEGGHHPVSPSQHILGRNGFGGLGSHLGGLRAQCRRLLLGIGALPAATLLVGGARVEVLLPAHVVDVGLAANGIEEPHPVDHLGEQPHIVADDDQSPAVVLEEVAQPGDGVRIEVVGRFVEQERGIRTRPTLTGGE